MQTEAASFWLLALPAVTVPSPHDRTQSGQGFQRGVPTRAFVLQEILRVAPALGNRHGHRLPVELASFHGCGGPLVAAEGVFVLLSARHLILLGQVLGGFDHAGDVAEPFFGRNGLPGAGQPVMQRNRAEPSAPTAFIRIELCVAHTFHAAGNDHVGILGLYQTLKR